MDLSYKTITAIFFCLILAASVSAHAAASGGAPPYQEAPPVEPVELGTPEQPCPPGESGWNMAQTVYGVEVDKSLACKPDNPAVVAAVTKGTNNVPMMALMETGLSEDAVRKGADLDGDGDPDVINITLEVAEVNGKNASGGALATNQAIAPGVRPAFWVFAPKTRGMATEGSAAAQLIRAPSPAIRVEQGDRVHVTLENTHYMPHTIHFHGVDHPFNDSEGKGNDGVPQVSETPVMPGESRTYEFTPRQSGTMFYHCHVQPNTHVLMGLHGMFVIEENHPDNAVQTFNIGNGKVRNPSKAVEERYDQEYDMHYQGVDKEMHDIPKVSNDPRVISQIINRQYDVTERTPDYFMLNGNSFPYTVRESQIIPREDQLIKTRVLNGGSESISLHTHGHKPTITHYDGVEAPETAQIQRDVFLIGAAQRLDLEINTTNDGINSYGPGAWFMHDHREEGVTTDGIAPGGGVSLITYESYLDQEGLPESRGVSWDPYFTEAYYDRKIPVWSSYDPTGLFGQASSAEVSNIILVMFGIIGVFLGGVLGREVHDRWM